MMDLITNVFCLLSLVGDNVYELKILLWKILSVKVKGTYIENLFIDISMTNWRTLQGTQWKDWRLHMISNSCMGAVSHLSVNPTIPSSSHATWSRLKGESSENAPMLISLCKFSTTTFEAIGLTMSLQICCLVLLQFSLLRYHTRPLLS